MMTDTNTNDTTYRPSYEQMEWLFQKYPNKTLREWGKEWGISYERVRQLKEQIGLPPRGSFDMETAEEIIEFIRSGKGTVSTARTYAKFPNVGKGRFLSWCKEYPEVKEKLEEAIAYADFQKKHPTHKKCQITGEVLPITEFYRDKNSIDGYGNRSKEAVKAMVKKYYNQREDVTEPTVTEKLCAAIPEIGNLPAEDFGRSTKSSTGLQTYCKKFQSEYQKLKGQDNAFDIAKQKTLDYYLEQGYTIANT
jgi:hypothetical protein